MYSSEELLAKLNTDNVGDALTLADIMLLSPSQLRKLADTRLTLGEMETLFAQAQQGRKENTVLESRLLSRANPQLHNLTHLDVAPLQEKRGYTEMFGRRADNFVAPGSVSSMFSPAAYLTELYREALPLHPESSTYHLKKRRSDLGQLLLSQANMDTELSTLTLSNEILMGNIAELNTWSSEKVMETLSTYRLSGNTPYHSPYAAIRQSVLQLDPGLSTLGHMVPPQVLMALEMDIPPETYNILTEDITDENTEELYEENFGSFPFDYLYSVDSLSHYYQLSTTEIVSLIEITRTMSKTYKNNVSLDGIVSNNGRVTTWKITRVRGSNYSTNVHYMDLFITQENRFYINTKYKSDGGIVSIRLTKPKSEYLTALIAEKTYKDTDYSSHSFSLNDNILAASFEIYLRRYHIGDDTNVKDNTYAGFTVERVSSKSFLLHLNKVVRLYKAVGFSLPDMERFALHLDKIPTFSSEFLHRTAYTQYLSQQYGISLDNGLMLCGADIGTASTLILSSQFDLLFNTPRLNGQTFALGDNAIEVHPDKLIPTDSFRRAVLKRTWQVDDAGLYTMHQIGNRSVAGGIDNTLANLSDLHRIALLAQVHALTVNELNTLLLLSPYRNTNLYGIDEPTLKTLTQYLFAVTEWLKEQKWSVYQLFIMVTDTYSTVWPPSLDDLQQTLLNGLDTQAGLQGDKLVTAMAPFIASSLKLNTSGLAESILLWTNQIQPNNQTSDTFWALMQKEIPDDAERNSIIAFAQTLAQLSIIVNTVNISEQELSLLVRKPTLLFAEIETLGLSVDILHQLTLFHRWINGSGVYVNDVLTALNDGSLTATLLASSLQEDLTQVTQAMNQAVVDAATLAHWGDVFAVIQWLKISKTLNITPDGVASLMALPHDSTTAYASWSSLGEMMLSALKGQKSDTVNSALNERLSAALSGYYIKEVSPIAINSRDALYSYLLIDNQVSAQVKTSRLAEAIASLQLYIHRTLTGQEEGADSAVLARKFFADWDTYNARYSTWAGVSQLVYYPENYIDPTMRVGQTQMMGDMLQDISQSNLNTDTIDAAFKSYLTKFEGIANLNIISGYQDHFNYATGLTYFIGTSFDNNAYYWRSVDQSLFVEGKYPANAWSEWRQVQTAITAFQDIVRPVVFNSRLNTVWLECENVTTKNNQGTDEVINKRSARLSKLNYDGSWSSPKEYPVDDILKGYSESELNALGMYCSNIEGNSGDVIIILLYVKKDSADQNKETKVSGFYISADYSSRTLSKEEVQEVTSLAYRDFDITDKGLVNKKILRDPTPNEVVFNYISEPGYDELTNVLGGKVLKIRQKEPSAEYFRLELDVDLQINYYGPSATSNSRQTQQCSMLKKFHGKTPGEFILFKTKPYETSSALYTVASVTGDSDKYLTETMFSNPTLERQYIIFYNDGIDYTCSITHKEMDMERPELYGITDLVSPLSDTRGVILVAIVSALSYGNEHYLINTGIAPSDVVITISVGSIVKRFTAENHVSRQPVFDLERMIYNFTDLSFDIPVEEFVNDSVTVFVECTAKAVDDRELGKEIFKFNVNRLSLSETVSFTRIDTYAQFLQRGPYRVRTNTLLAQQLITKVNAGVGQVLAMDTQRLPEPQMGNGSYISVTLPKYNATVHGSSRIARVTIWRGRDNDDYDFWRGSLLDIEQNVTLFVPLSRLEKPFYDIINFPYNPLSGLDIFLSVGDSRFKAGNLKTTIQGNSFRITGYTPSKPSSMTVVLLPETKEPMDFHGANALYFWEMFYYTPKMTYARLLQEERYDEALTWLKYIWSPAGYISPQGHKEIYYWNCRPLEESTSWNTTPLDSVDPDAVAQNDPMHYKVATFMNMLDLLIARGDTAYRQLERDTLNEAKMWYIQAFNLLGGESYVPMNNEWETPTLDSAADATTWSGYQQALLTLRETGLPAPLTANSLGALFMPEVNGKLQDYWQVLAQRLYNLRHNLSINGQPLSLPLYATPVSPEALLSAAVAASQGGGALSAAVMPLYRFPVILENTRSLVGQLIQFGNTLLNLIERQDGEALTELLQTQARDLSMTAIAMQDKTIVEVDADEKVLQSSRQGVQKRYITYADLHDENINTGEKQAMDLYLSASVIAASGDTLRTAAAAMNLAPNIYGLAVGGSKFGAMFDAMAISTNVASQATSIAGDRISYNENYRRRRQEWAIQRNNAEDELKQIDAQLVSLGIRREAAVLQKSYMESQQAQTQAQLEFLQRKFSNKALYNWLRGCLSAIYYQFYDLTVSRCLMSQEAYRWEMNQPGASFIKPGAWSNTYAGLMAGEKLMLNLIQMEDAYLKQDERPMEVMRTVSLAQLYAALPDSKGFVLADGVKILLNSGNGQVGTDENGLKLDSDSTLVSSVKLVDLAIMDDYPAKLGKIRRIKQISVTLPMLMGPYQDVQAVLGYGGSVVVPRGCNTLAVSHGMNDSGQFQLDFNDAQLLPFEGIPVNDNGTLMLSFPNATGKQKTLLLSLNDIILHIRYTIRY